MLTDKALLTMMLRANAIFSLLSGIVLAAAPSTVGGWLGVDIDGWLRLFGLALLLHAVVLSVAARTEPVDRWAMINLVMISPYPLLMIVAAIGFVDEPLGRVLVLADGLVIATIPAGHWAGLGRSPEPELAA